MHDVDKSPNSHSLSASTTPSWVNLSDDERRLSPYRSDRASIQSTQGTPTTYLENEPEVVELYFSSRPIVLQAPALQLPPTMAAVILIASEAGLHAIGTGIGEPAKAPEEPAPVLHCKLPVSIEEDKSNSVVEGVQKTPIAIVHTSNVPSTTERSIEAPQETSASTVKEPVLPSSTPTTLAERTRRAKQKYF